MVLTATTDQTCTAHCSSASAAVETPTPHPRHGWNFPLNSPLWLAKCHYRESESSSSSYIYIWGSSDFCVCVCVWITNTTGLTSLITKKNSALTFKSDCSKQARPSSCRNRVGGCHRVITHHKAIKEIPLCCIQWATMCRRPIASLASDVAPVPSQYSHHLHFPLVQRNKSHSPPMRREKKEKNKMSRWKHKRALLTQKSGVKTSDRVKSSPASSYLLGINESRAKKT